jgi:hypothetical protein
MLDVGDFFVCSVNLLTLDITAAVQSTIKSKRENGKWTMRLKVEDRAITLVVA